MARTVEFLEVTAKAVQNQDHKYGRAVVNFSSHKGTFAYYEIFPGGMLKEVSRDDIDALMQAK